MLSASSLCSLELGPGGLARGELLKQEVGSYALMGDSGFGSMDFLQCCKFAEGDSRVLMLKMARDRLRSFAKEAKLAGGKPTPRAGEEEEFALCAKIARSLTAAQGDKAAEVTNLDRTSPQHGYAALPLPLRPRACGS